MVLCRLKPPSDGLWKFAACLLRGLYILVQMATIVRLVVQLSIATARTTFPQGLMLFVLWNLVSSFGTYTYCSLLIPMKQKWGQFPFL